MMTKQLVRAIDFRAYVNKETLAKSSAVVAELIKSIYIHRRTIKHPDWALNPVEFISQAATVFYRQKLCPLTA